MGLIEHVDTGRVEVMGLRRNAVLQASTATPTRVPVVPMSAVRPFNSTGNPCAIARSTRVAPDPVRSPGTARLNQVGSLSVNRRDRSIVSNTAGLSVMLRRSPVARR